MVQTHKSYVLLVNCWYSKWSSILALHWLQKYWDWTITYNTVTDQLLITFHHSSARFPSITARVSFPLIKTQCEILSLAPSAGVVVFNEVVWVSLTAVKYNKHLWIVDVIHARVITLPVWVVDGVEGRGLPVGATSSSEPPYKYFCHKHFVECFLPWFCWTMMKRLWRKVLNWVQSMKLPCINRAP